MKLKHAYQNIFQPTLGIIGAFCLLSFIFVGAYLYVDYRNYLSSHKTLQQHELKAARSKANLNIENIKKLSILSSKRISTAQGNINRIHNILISSHSLLPDAEFLKIQKMTYEKKSHPQLLITRLGIVSLDNKNLSEEIPHDKGPLIFFNQKSVYSNTWVFNKEGRPEGILEVHVALSHFKETLKIGSTVSFLPGATHILLQKDPFPIYGKLPESFWGYFLKSVGHYTMFFLFIIFAICFILLSNIYSHFRIKQTFQDKMENLRDELSELETESNKANDAFLTNQKKLETHQITCQSYNQFQTDFLNRQREQLHHVLRSVDVVMGSLKNPNSSLPSHDLLDILKPCVNILENIMSGTLSASKHEPVNIIKTLNSVRSVFIEKMYKSDLTVEIYCPENLIYYGDPLLLEFILLNLIGKSIHMVPKNGKIEIKVVDQKEGLSVQVKDNGFPFNEKSQKQIIQSFDFFIPDKYFQRLCQENGFFYEYSKDKNGLNVAKIFFPKEVAEALHNNVVPLFNKN